MSSGERQRGKEEERRERKYAASRGRKRREIRGARRTDRGGKQSCDEERGKEGDKRESWGTAGSREEGSGITVFNLNYRAFLKGLS